MNSLTPNTRFLLYGATFKIDFVADGKVRFHNTDDVYDVWQLEEGWLLDKLRTGRLKIVLDNTHKENQE